MAIFLWALSFVFLAVGAVVGVGASIGALEADWYWVSLFCLVGMLGAAVVADETGD